MKTTKLLSLIIATFVGVSQSAWAGHDGGGGFGGGSHFGGGHPGGGGRVGGFGGNRMGGFSGNHFAGFRPAPASPGGGFRVAPRFSGGGTSMAGRYYTGPGRASQFHYGPAARPSVRLDGTTGLSNRSARTSVARTGTIGRQQNRVGTFTRQNSQASASRMSSSFRRSIANNRTFGRHDGNWHRDWDRNHFHHWGGHWWGWYGGYWIGFDPGLYPFDYYPDGNYPLDYYGYPYDYNYDSYPGGYQDSYDSDPYNYDDSSSAGSAASSNPTVSAVQSTLEQLGYYHGGIDGVLGDETEAAIARYQEDHDLSVTGTVTAAVLHALGVG